MHDHYVGKTAEVSSSLRLLLPFPSTSGKKKKVIERRKFNNK